jgi:hypothetical protein
MLTLTKEKEENRYGKGRNRKAGIRIGKKKRESGSLSHHKHSCASSEK